MVVLGGSSPALLCHSGVPEGVLRLTLKEALFHFVQIAVVSTWNNRSPQITPCCWAVGDPVQTLRTMPSPWSRVQSLWGDGLQRFRLHLVFLCSSHWIYLGSSCVQVCDAQNSCSSGKPLYQEANKWINRVLEGSRASERTLSLISKMPGGLRENKGDVKALQVAGWSVWVRREE